MSKIKNAYNRAKKYAGEHIEDITAGVVLLLGGVGFLAGVTYLANHAVPRSSEGKHEIEELAIPNWDPMNYEIEDLWANNNFDRTMIVNVNPLVMGEFGEKIINDLGHNPDLKVSLIMDYFEG